MIKRLGRKIFRHVTAPLRKVLSWLYPMPDMPDIQGVMVEKQGSDHALPVVYGTRRVGGIKVHKFVTDAPGGAENEFLHLIVLLCEGPVHAIEEVFFNGISEHDAQWNKDGGGKWFTISRHLGAHDQPASAAAVSGIPNWTVNHRLQGIAYLYIRLQMDEQQSIWRGEPEIVARVAGRTIHDPRTGQTGYSENPALQLLDYLQDPVYGKGMPAGRLNMASFIAAANLCDQTVDNTAIINGVATGQVAKRFTGNQVIDTSRSVFANVQQMLQGMRGMLPIGTGQIRLQLEGEGEPGFLFSHDRNDEPNHATIVGPIKSSSGKKNGRYNRAIVRFANKDADYEQDEVFWPANNNPLAQQWLDEDNGVRLEQSFEFPGITNKAEALQMAEIIAKRSRNQMVCSFTASPLAIRCEPGDIVGITDDTRGWDAKPFRVEQTKHNEDGSVELDFIEHQNAVYPWSGTTYEERIGGTNLGDPTNIPAPTGLTLTPDPTLQTGGRLTWSTPANAFVRRYQVNVFAGAALLFSEETAARTITLPLLDAGEYTITVRAISSLGTYSPAATLAFTLALPVPPTDIAFEVSSDAISARPVLAGAGMGTTFDMDIVIGDGENHPPSANVSGYYAVFIGLPPNTLHTVFCRTRNALGSSEWISFQASTTEPSEQVVDLILDRIKDDIINDEFLDDVASRIELEDYEELQQAIDNLQQAKDSLQSGQQQLSEQLDLNGSAILLLQQSDTEQAQSILLLGTKAQEAENSIAQLVQTTESHATSLLQLNSRAADAESNISQLLQTTEGHATSLLQLNSRAADAESNISQLFDTRPTSSTVTTMVSTAKDEAVTSAVDSAKTYTDSQTDELKAERVLKVDANGKVAGFGLFAGATSGTRAYLAADRIAFLNSYADDVSAAGLNIPFIVENNTTYIDDARIKKLTANRIIGGGAVIESLAISNEISTPLSWIEEEHLHPSLLNQLVRRAPGSSSTGGSGTASRQRSAGIGQTAVTGFTTAGIGNTISVSVTGGGSENQGSTPIPSVTVRVFESVSGTWLNFGDGNGTSLTITGQVVDLSGGEPGVPSIYRATINGHYTFTWTPPSSAVNVNYILHVTSISGLWTGTISCAVNEPNHSSEGLIVNTAWSAVSGKPFSSVGNRLSTSGDVLNVNSTNSRTSTSSTSLLEARAMNDHRTSGDHDARYLRSGEALSIPHTLNLDSGSYNNHLRITRVGHGRLEVTPSGSDIRFMLHDGASNFRMYGSVILDSGSFQGNGSGLTGTASLRATGTTKADVGLAGIPNTNGSTANFLRGDGSWVTPPNTTYSAGNGISLSGTTFSVAGGDGLTQQASGLAVDGTVVRTSGGQTIGGEKLFTDPPTFRVGTTASPIVIERTGSAGNRYIIGMPNGELNIQLEGSGGSGAGFAMDENNNIGIQRRPDGHALSVNGRTLLEQTESNSYAVQFMGKDNLDRDTNALLIRGANGVVSGANRYELMVEQVSGTHRTLYFRMSSNNRFSIDASGYIYAQRFYATSSRRFKDVDHVEGQGESVRRVKAIGKKGVSVGRYKTDDVDAKNRWLIAEDVHEVSPEVVVKDHEGKVKSLDYTQLIPDLYAALANALQRIEYLENRR